MTDYEKAAVKALGTKSGQYHEPHLFQTEIVAEPAAFKFVWYATHADKPEPLFLSADTFYVRDVAEKSYETFVTEFPRLKLQIQQDQGKPTCGMILQKADTKQTPQESHMGPKGNAADIPTAQLAHQYVAQVYPDSQEAQDAFIEQSMVMNGNGLFAWRFLKKNDPVAIHPKEITSREDAEKLKIKLCAIIPQFEQDCCKHEPLVICSEVTKKYHFIVRFPDTEGGTFELQGISQAMIPMRKPRVLIKKNGIGWLIKAQNPENYGTRMALIRVGLKKD